MPASAEESLGTAEVSVVGWTGNGEALVTRLESRGERLVDGASKDFYFRITEMRDPTTGEVSTRYRHGEPTGATHPVYEKANPREKADARLEEAGLSEAEQTWISPDAARALTTYGGSKLVEVQHPRRGKQYVCAVKQRLVLLDADDDTVHVLEDWTERGDPASKKKEAYCPEPTLDAYWHPDSSRWAIVRTLMLTGAQVRPPEVHAGLAEAGDSGADSQPLLRNRRPLDRYLSSLDDEALREAWSAFLSGEYERATSRFGRILADTPDSTEASLGLALIQARRGNPASARKHLERAAAGDDKNFWYHGQVAAVYSLLLNTDRANEHLQKSQSAADSYANYVRVAELFRYIDLEISNRLLVRSLKTEDAKPNDEDYRYAYSLLVDGLVDAGMYREAKILFDKVDPLPPLLRAQQLRAEMEQAAPDVFDKEHMTRRTAALLFKSPGLCTGHLLFGRALAQRGELGRAYRQFRTAHLCAPRAPESNYYLGALELRLGNKKAAADHLETYLRTAVERANDDNRTTRRTLAGDYLARLEHTGAVLTSVQCQSGRFGKLICRGVVENTADEKISEVEVRAVQTAGGQPTTMSAVSLPSIAPGTSQNFSVRFSASSLETVEIRAGRNQSEMKTNRTPAIFK